MKISVVMTTFQGARYVTQQLTSILDQDRPPEELIVADDGSTDGTPDIVRDLTRSAGLPATILEASRNLGLRRNMDRALRAATGDVLVLSDQDDLWRHDKLRHVAAAFARPEVTLWASNAELVDGDGEDLGRHLWDAVRLTPASRDEIESGRLNRRLLAGQTLTGATMAFRASVLSVALPLPDALDGPDHLFLHDGWIAALASVVGQVMLDPEPLVRYRQHAAQVTQMSLMPALGEQATGSTPPHDGARERDLERRRVGLLADRLTVAGRAQDAHPGVDELARLDRFLAGRAGVSGVGRLAFAARATLDGSYRRYARGVLSAGKDLFR
ncbi:glycosyltransferase family 2 protein [Luteimicrobium xylanilyticum]